MKQMRASAFKARCLKIMNEIQATGEPVIVTKRGKPVVKIVPAEPEKGNILGFMAGKGTIIGDIESPPVPFSDWKIMKEFPLRRRKASHRRTSRSRQNKSRRRPASRP
ncbi:MAG: type II toxin-antitoxin system Phd/YefM family antitoxin [Acidobacteriia bacterium]|nr:type II toxin-antitoxin system Phd/YefM family antitoxin [Terriglobia bacterium]